jgi:hypothetical protein
MKPIKPANIPALLAATLSGVLFSAPDAEAKTEWLLELIQEYPSASRLATCGTCHRNFTSDSQGENPYGNDFKGAGGNNNPRAAMRAIAGDDSDGDGFTNLAEITRGTGFMPGWACSNYTDASNEPADLANYVDPGNIGCLAPTTTTTTRPPTTTTTRPPTTTTTRPPTTTTTRPPTTTTTVPLPTTTTTRPLPTTTTTTSPTTTTTIMVGSSTTVTPSTTTTSTTSVPPCESGEECGEVLLYPIADTHIEAGREGAWDHGTSRHLLVDGSPAGITYIKFDLTGVPGSVTRATLRLYATSRSRDGGAIYRILDSSWIEGTESGAEATSANGPGLKWVDVDTNGDRRLDGMDGTLLNPDPTQVVTKIGRVQRQRAYEIEVTPAFQDGPGIYTLAIASRSADGATFGSGEHPFPNRRPLLRVDSTALDGDDGEDDGDDGDDEDDDKDPFCGDGVRTLPEECDGSQDAACPGACSQDCTCAPVPAPTGGGADDPPAALSPIADTYIETGDEATWEHGASDHLDVDGSPFGVTYLKFDLSRVSEPVRSAVLQLHVSNDSEDGGEIYRIPDTSWVEGSGNGVDETSAGGAGLTWIDVDTNGDGRLDARDASPLRPGPSDRVARFGEVRKGTTYRIDVTAAFQDGRGVYTLAIMNTSRDGMTFSSREHPSSGQRPVLYVNGVGLR